MRIENLELTVPKELQNYFATHPKMALAFSGGADSAYLLYAAKACDVDVYAYYVNTQFQPAFELADAQKLADALEVPLTVLDLDVLRNTTVASNSKDRCYYCKRLIFEHLVAAAAKDGYNVLMDGTNASDNAEDRPGMRALQELQVVSPLRECGITKRQLREYSKCAALFTWSKPAYACLATRIQTGVHLDASMLDRIENAEYALFELGFVDFRVRVCGEMAKLQVSESQFELAVRQRENIIEQILPYFKEVLLDFKPREAEKFNG